MSGNKGPDRRSSQAGSTDGGDKRPASSNNRQGRPSLTDVGMVTRRHSNMSVTRQNKRGPRGSRVSHTGSRMNMAGESGVPVEKIQVIDEDGVDRTPKPLVSLKPTIMKNHMAGGASSSIGGDYDSQTPNSELSMNFLDRMSSAGFSTGAFSASNSGDHTPVEVEEDEDYAAQKERERKLMNDDDTLAAEDDAADRERRRAKRADGEGAGDAEDHERIDLDQTFSITMQETDTFFLVELRGISVSVESEEAKRVEEANARYRALLAAKQASDRFMDGEAQTLNNMVKGKEVQLQITASVAAGCQASTWDISDTYHQQHQSHDGEDDKAMISTGVTVEGLAAAAAHGAGSQQPPHAAGGNASLANTQRTSRQADRRISEASTRNGSILATNNPMQAVQQGSSTAVPGSAGSGDGDMRVEVLEDPLEKLHGLPEVLALMDAALTQNLYLDKLVLYRDVRPIIRRAVQARGGTAATQAQHGGTPPHAASINGVARPGTLAVTPGAGPTTPGTGVPFTPGGAVTPGSSRSTIMRSTVGRGLVEHDDQHSRSASASVVPGLDQLEAEDCEGRASSPPQGPRMELLWEWSCPITEGLNISCMAWNKAQPDLLAVGYGSFRFGDQHEGLVAFWSLKNPEYPLWFFRTKSGVTALDFSGHSPSILAVGFYDGAVAIYDVKSRQASATMESTAQNGKHSDPAWKVHWLDRGPEREEVLISISTDGRITQWSIAKGLEFTDLMKLKRVRRNTGNANPSCKPSTAAAAAQASEQEAFISRLTSGMSFDFSHKDVRIYIAGTEDGWIHKCSTSYSEQYLESYQGHMGPVYQVQWSPFRSDLFISSGSDWTVRMWQEGREVPLLTFQDGSHEVSDVQWCPGNSTAFGAVTTGGRIEVWDFAMSTLRPVASHAHPDSKLSCLLFSPTSPVVVCGGDRGAVSVYRLFNVEQGALTKSEQVRRMDEALRANVMKTQPNQAV